MQLLILHFPQTIFLEKIMHGLKGYYFKKLVAIDKDKEGFLFSFIFNSIRKNGEVINKSNNIMSRTA